LVLDRPFDFLSINAYPIARFENLGDSQYNMSASERQVHDGLPRPSAIDQTLQKSGPLPIPFLRGVGLPENLIDHLPALTNQAIQYYSYFISYSTKDQSFADRIHGALSVCTTRLADWRHNTR